MHRSAFTLIELLVVIAVIAVLAIVIVLTLNPAQLLMQSRDSNRIADMSTLNSAIGIYAASGGTSFGNANTVYVSIPDPSATSTAGDQCQGLGLPTLPSMYSYQCAASSTFRLSNGTGWIPVNFASIAGGSPLSQLPVDPINQSSSRLYYTYDTNGTQYEVTAVMESQKYQLGGANDVIGTDGGTLASVYEKGSQLGLEPLDYGDPTLVGWWNFSEGSSSVAYDYSGNNATGSWNGTAVGTNGYYSPGKIGNWAGAFNGSNDYVNVPTSSFAFPTAAFSVVAWANVTDNGSFRNIVSKTNGSSAWPFDSYVSNGTSNMILIVGNGSTSKVVTASGVVNFGTWQQWGFVYNGTSMSTYLNGSLVAGPTAVGFSFSDSPYPLRIGERNDNGTVMKGLTDDVRIYSRVLTAAQIASMYNGGK